MGNDFTKNRTTGIKIEFSVLIDEYYSEFYTEKFLILSLKCFLMFVVTYFH